MKSRSHWPLSIPYGICSIINLLLPLVLVRLLPIQTMGHYKIYFLYFTIGQWLLLGPAIRNGISFWLRNPAYGIQAVRAAWTVLVFSSSILLVHFLLFSHPTARLLGLTQIEAALLFGSIFFTALGNFYEEALIASGEIWRGGLYYLIFETLKTLLVITAAFWSKSLLSVLIVFFTAQALKFFVSILRSSEFSLNHLSIDQVWIKKVLSYVFPIYLAALIGVLLNYADQLIASHSLSTREFAFYSLGCLSLPPLLLLEQSVNRLLIPQLTAELAQGLCGDRPLQLMSEAIEELGTYLIPSVFGLVLFASPIIDILFTQQYEAAVPYLRIYSLDYLCLMIPFDAVQRARGDSLWILKNSAVFLMISLTLGVAAVPILGAYGPLSILLITHILIRFSALRYLKLKMSWDWHQVIPSKTLLRFALVSTGFSGIALLIRPLFASQTQWFLSCGPVIMILYLGTVLPWRWGEKAKRSSELRILMITQYLGIGGLEKMIFHLSHGLQKAQRKRAFVFAYEETEKTAELLELFEAHSIQVEIYRKHRGFSPLAVFKLVSYIFQNDIHLVHTHDLGALIYGAFAKVFSLGKVKLVHSQHTFVHLEKFGKRVGSKYAIYEKIFSLVPNQICPVSESIRDRYIELGLNPKRAQVILNGTPFPQHHSTPSMTPEAHPESRRQLLIKSIQSEPIRLRLLEQSRDIWILCLARISIEKGQRHILKIWENLPEADKAATTLLFVGPLSSSSPEPPEPCDLRFSNRVFYLGPTQKPDLWIRESHLFVSGSEFEGLPLGPLEALGSGRPAFLSNIAGHQLLSPWSELFSLEKLDQASQQLSQLIQKIQTQRTLDQTESYYQELWNRTSNLRETFSLEKMVKSYGEIYDRTYL